MALSLKFTDWLEARRAPDYSFDKWVAGAEKLKSDLHSTVQQAKSSEEKLDKELDKKEKEVKEKKKQPPPPKEDGKEDEEHEKLWDRLKKTAEEMSKERVTRYRKYRYSMKSMLPWLCHYSSLLI